MNVEINPNQLRKIGLGVLLLAGLLGFSALAKLSASDLRRYLKMRSM